MDTDSVMPFIEKQDGLARAEKVVMTFDEAVQAYSDMVTRICLIHLINRSDAEDCWQNTFLALFQNPRILHRGPEAVKRWLIRVARNKCTDENRRQSRRGASLEQPEETAYWDDYSFELVDALRALPETYREAVYLHYFEGWTTREIAQFTHRKESTIKSHLHRARKMLKGEIEYA